MSPSFSAAGSDSLASSESCNPVMEFSMDEDAVSRRASTVGVEVPLRIDVLATYVLCESLSKVTTCFPASSTEFWSTVNWMAAAAA